MIIQRDDLAQMIDHALLAPNMTDDEIVRGIEVARKYKVAGVCVKPYAVRLAAYHLQGTGIQVGTVISFPHGNASTRVKALEAEKAIEDGATELDMVINIGKALGGDWDYIRQDIREVVDIAHSRQAIVKVIFENHYFKNDQKIRLCEICTETKADFVKTSTGFAETGATLQDVQLMRKYCPRHIRIKAAGGIRTLEQFLQFKTAGAERIGVSATEKILDAVDEKNTY